MESPSIVREPAPYPLTASICNVTVYPDRAKIVRQGTLTADTGQMTIILGPLPATLSPASVQLSSVANSALQVQTVTVHPWTDLDLQPALSADGHSFAAPSDKRQSLSSQNSLPALAADGQTSQVTGSALQPRSDDPSMPDSSIPNPEGHLSQLTHQHCQVKAMLEALRLQQDFLQKLAHQAAETYAGGLATGEMSLETVQALLQFLQDQQTQLSVELASQTRQASALEQQIQTASQSGSHPPSSASTPPQTPYGIEALLEVNQPGEYPLNLSYTVSGVSWAPSYVARLNTLDKTIELIQLADIQQESGENWPNVRLTLSTARGHHEPGPGALSRWQITLPKQIIRPGDRPDSAGINPALSDETYRMFGALPGSELPPVPCSEAAPSASFPLDLKRVMSHRTILTQVTREPQTLKNQQSNTVEMGRAIYPCQLLHIAALPQNESPYLQAEILYPEEQPNLLPGPVKLFRDAIYVGAEPLLATLPGESIQLYFGTSEDILISRVQTTRDIVLGNSRQEIHGYRLLVQNRGQVPQRCVVVERIPESQHEMLHVRLTKTHPKVTLAKNGRCEWHLDLLPETEQVIEYQFTVDGPVNSPIAGLE